MATTTMDSYNHSDGTLITAPFEEQDKTINPTFIMQKIYLVIGIMGMLDNSMVAVILLTSKDLRRKTTNMFIINQSFIDFTVSFFIILSNYFRDITKIPTYLGRQLFCRLWLTNLGIWGPFIASSYNLIFMTAERYFALVHPLKHSVSVSKSKIRPLLGLTWFIGFAIDIVLATPTSYMPDPNTCFFAAKFHSELGRKCAAIFYALFAFVLPLVVIIYSYTMIVYTIKKSAVDTNQSTKLSKAKKNVIKTLALMCVCFLLCWSGNTVYFIMYIWGAAIDWNSPFYHFTVVAVFINCCTNPIVYAIKYDDFQERVIYLLCHKFRKNTDDSDFSDSRTSNTQI